MDHAVSVKPSSPIYYLGIDYDLRVALTDRDVLTVAELCRFAPSGLSALCHGHPAATAGQLRYVQARLRCFGFGLAQTNHDVPIGALFRLMGKPHVTLVKQLLKKLQDQSGYREIATLGKLASLRMSVLNYGPSTSRVGKPEDLMAALFELATLMEAFGLPLNADYPLHNDDSTGLLSLDAATRKILARSNKFTVIHHILDEPIAFKELPGLGSTRLSKVARELEARGFVLPRSVFPVR